MCERACKPCHELGDAINLVIESTGALTGGLKYVGTEGHASEAKVRIPPTWQPDTGQRLYRRDRLEGSVLAAPLCRGRQAACCFGACTGGATADSQLQAFAG